MQRWDLVERERSALADLLEGLTDEHWDTPSLCAGWRVREVAAHLMVGPTASGREVALAVLRHRGSFSRAMDAMARERAAAPAAALVETLRAHAASRFHPPMLDWHAPLTDVLVHREDITVPLGLPQDRPTDAWAIALTYLTTRWGRLAFETGRYHRSAWSPPTRTGRTVPVPRCAARRARSPGADGPPGPARPTGGRGGHRGRGPGRVQATVASLFTCWTPPKFLASTGPAPRSSWSRRCAGTDPC